MNHAAMNICVQICGYIFSLLLDILLGVVLLHYYSDFPFHVLKNFAKKFPELLHLFTVASAVYEGSS